MTYNLQQMIDFLDENGGIRINGEGANHTEIDVALYGENGQIVECYLVHRTLQYHDMTVAVELAVNGLGGIDKVTGFSFAERKAALSHTTEIKNTEIINVLRIGGSPNELYAAQRIEELEKQIADLEFQVKIAPLKAFIEMYDDEKYNEDDVFEFLQNFLKEPDWGTAIWEIYVEWDNENGGMGGDPNYYLNRIREVIGMALPK